MKTDQSKERAKVKKVYKRQQRKDEKRSWKYEVWVEEKMTSIGRKTFEKTYKY